MGITRTLSNLASIITTDVGNSRIGIVTGTKVLIDSIIEANENSLIKYMKENFKGV